MDLSDLIRQNIRTLTPYSPGKSSDEVKRELGLEEIIKLATQKKHLTNVIKLVAYQAESEMVRLLSPHYRRAQLEGRTLVHSALASAADIKVTDSELLITLAPLSSAHRSRAVAALCTSLNATATIFPGTRLRLRYAVAGQT